MLKIICATIYPTNNKIMYWNVRKNGMEYKKKYLVEYKKKYLMDYKK